MRPQSIGYALACVVVPMAWGLLVVWASNGIERWVRLHGLKRGRTDGEATLPPLDYHI